MLILDRIVSFHMLQSNKNVKFFEEFFLILIVLSNSKVFSNLFFSITFSVSIGLDLVANLSLIIESKSQDLFMTFVRRDDDFFLWEFFLIFLIECTIHLTIQNALVVP